MQCKRFPPKRDILIKQGVAYVRCSRRTDARCWDDRLRVMQPLLKRFPDLAIRNTQIVKKARDGVEYDAVVSVFERCARAIIKENTGPSRIFSLEETGVWNSDLNWRTPQTFKEQEVARRKGIPSGKRSSNTTRRDPSQFEYVERTLTKKTNLPTCGSCLSRKTLTYF
uniref:AlNc14C11G1379 protein n=1 Tax=Albugo laibachii Nc14 TaxID=890382 RepID=F0W300_9STRA|nr:AlNc14C11G1379 [Albugo laibachii Nc14]|eukprot:CCA15437.1 AlNc14C11G1379 [Albugo laibachii Nc14]